MGTDPKIQQLWTRAAIADELGIDRKRVTRLLRGVEPDGKTGKNKRYDGYLLKTVIPVLYGLDEQGEEGAAPTDPDSLDPKGRRDWYEGTRTKQALEQAAGLLVTVADHRRSLAEFATAVVAGFENLPDIAERDFGLPPEVVQLTQDAVDRARALAHELVTTGSVGNDDED